MPQGDSDPFVAATNPKQRTPLGDTEPPNSKYRRRTFDEMFCGLLALMWYYLNPSRNTVVYHTLNTLALVLTFWVSFSIRAAYLHQKCSFID